jgi:hypothetical protein
MYRTIGVPHDIGMVALIVRNRTIERDSEVSYDWYHAIMVSQKVPRVKSMA